MTMDEVRQLQHQIMSDLAASPENGLSTTSGFDAPTAGPGLSDGGSSVSYGYHLTSRGEQYPTTYSSYAPEVFRARREQGETLLHQDGIKKKGRELLFYD